MMKLLALLVLCLAVAVVSADNEASGVVSEETLDLDIGEEKPISTDEAGSTRENVPINNGGEVPKAEEKAEEGASMPVHSDEKEKAEENTTGGASGSETAPDDTEEQKPPVQTGPLIDLLGPALLSLDMIDETHAQLKPHYTSDALRGKKVIGLYFSADWCNPCRQFTPELTSFYNKINARRGKKDEFEIVWVSRCRDMNSFGQYFTQMGNWLALPPEDAMGERGQFLSQKYKVKSIPTLVLLDDMGNVITTDGRNKIPQDKAGIGFPWRNPIATLYMTVFPRSLRMMVKSQIATVKDGLLQKAKHLLGLKRPAKA